MKIEQFECIQQFSKRFTRLSIGQCLRFWCFFPCHCVKLSKVFDNTKQLLKKILKEKPQRANRANNLKKWPSMCDITPNTRSQKYEMLSFFASVANYLSKILEGCFCNFNVASMLLNSLILSALRELNQFIINCRPERTEAWQRKVSQIWQINHTETRTGFFASKL